MNFTPKCINVYYWDRTADIATTANQNFQKRRRDKTEVIHPFQ